jgi:hypothetical protein
MYISGNYYYYYFHYDYYSTMLNIKNLFVCVFRFVVCMCMDKGVSRNQVENTVRPRYLLSLRCMYKWRMGSRWYTSDFHIATIDI